MENSESNEQSEILLDRLRTMRDELRVRAHLGNMELKESLRDLEERLADAERLAKRTSEAVVSKLCALEARFSELSEKLASAEPLGGAKGMNPG